MYMKMSYILLSINFTVNKLCVMWSIFEHFFGYLYSAKTFSTSNFVGTDYYKHFAFIGTLNVYM